MLRETRIRKKEERSTESCDNFERRGREWKRREALILNTVSYVIHYVPHSGNHNDQNAKKERGQNHCQPQEKSTSNLSPIDRFEKRAT